MNEIIVAGFALVVVAVIFLSVSQSELKAKIELLISASSINWKTVVSDDVKTLIGNNDLTQAALKLRSQTGLSLGDCTKIVQSILSEQRAAPIA